MRGDQVKTKKNAFKNAFNYAAGALGRAEGK
jgi:hypothetical protein